MKLSVARSRQHVLLLTCGDKTRRVAEGGDVNGSPCKGTRELYIRKGIFEIFFLER